MLNVIINWVTRGGLAKNLFSWKPFSAELTAVPVNEQRVLLAANMYWEQFLNMYTLLAAALKLRGAQVDVVVNDGVLPACEKCVQSKRTPKPTRHSLDAMRMRKLFKPLGVKLIMLSDVVTATDRSEAERFANEFDLSQIDTFTPDGIAVGEHAKAGALRFFAKGTLEQEPEADHVLRQYLAAALLTKWAYERILKQTQYNVVCAHHGIYVPQGIVGEVARQQHVRVVNWNVAYRERCFIFSHDDTYHHTLMTEPANVWDTLPFTKELDTTISEYLLSRQRGSKDWISFNRAPQEDKTKIIQELGIDPAKPTVAMLTNVIWDAQLHYEANVFPNMIDWVIKTVRYFINRPDLQLVIRVHPAEVKGTIPSRQLMVDEIQKAFPQLPSNIIIIPPQNPISTYVVASFANAAIIYGTKTGVELVTTGLPVIVAGEAWVKHKGLTTDPSNEEEYFNALAALPLQNRLSETVIERGKRYAYHFFFRRMIPVQAIQTTQSIYFNLNVKSLTQIAPQADPGLDVICNGILAGEPFIYPHEQFGALGSGPEGYALDLR